MSAEFSEDGKVALSFLFGLFFTVIASLLYAAVTDMWSALVSAIEVVVAVDEIVLSIPMTSEVAFGVVVGVVLVVVVDRAINRAKEVVGR